MPGRLSARGSGGYRGLSKPRNVRGRKKISGEKTMRRNSGRFIDERCVGGDKCRATATALYAAYKQWATDGGERTPLTSTAFGTKLTDRGFAKIHSERGAVYLAIGLRSHDEQSGG